MIIIRNPIFTMKQNIFRSSDKKQSSNNNKYLNINDTNLFPSLNDNFVSTNVVNNTTNFKDALNVEIVKSNNNESHIPFGWVNIKKVDGKFLYKYGEIIESKEKDHDINTLMNKAIDVMKNNWNSYERYYDELHGEGEFYEKYKRFMEDDINYVTDDEDEDEDDDNISEIYDDYI
jgi:hypothetical protein